MSPFRYTRTWWKCSFHAPSLVADNAIMHRSLAICTTTKEISTILLGNEGDGDSGLSCVHSVVPHL